MDIQFNAANPRERARPLIDAVLDRGTDQIAIVCPYLTAAGAQMLKRHAPRLGLPGSFLVVAWEPPTTDFVDALRELHCLFPGNLYVHLGARTPVEKRAGSGLMHSKMFFARAGSHCWLWTGSHNLTGNAIQGGNCEAAVVVGGTTDEKLFHDALAHMERCRQEAIVFDPYNPPKVPPAHDTLIIHAERHVALRPHPWHVHLRATTTEYDDLMRPPSSVWLYLYSPGSLARGHRRPRADAAYSGTLTAINLTEHHRERGIAADWQQADFVIEQDQGVWHLLAAAAQRQRVVTQGIFRVQSDEDPSTVWLTASPRPREERVIGNTWTSEVDADLRRFFTSSSVEGGRLVHRDYAEIRRVYRVPRREAGLAELTALEARFSELAEASIEIDETVDLDESFAFIYRAKYRL